MKKFDYTITDELGMHARPAGLFVKLVKSLDSTVTVKKGETETEATRLIALMGMGIKQGDVITLLVDGGDEESSAEKLEAFLKENL